MQTSNTSKTPTVEDSFYLIGWCLIGLTMIYILFSAVTGFHITHYMMPCILHSLTGYYCPGCGGTRAVLSLMHGDLLRSFLYHPFVPYAAVICGWFMLSQSIERISGHRIRIGMRYHDYHLWIALVLVVLSFVVKNILLLGWGIRLI